MTEPFRREPAHRGAAVELDEFAGERPGLVDLLAPCRMNTDERLCPQGCMLARPQWAGGNSAPSSPFKAVTLGEPVHWTRGASEMVERFPTSSPVRATSG